MSRRSIFSVLAVAATAAGLFASAASAQFIWGDDDDYVSLSRPVYSYKVQPGNTTNYARFYPVTVTRYGSVTVSGPATIVLPANQSSVTVLYTFNQATTTSAVAMSHQDPNNVWQHSIYFTP